MAIGMNMMYSYSVLIIKQFFMANDLQIHSFIKMMFQIIEALAQIDIFNDSSIADFSTRIYSVMALFMFFKISFSFVNYIINPDKFMEKSIGFQKIIVNIILVLVMLMGMPMAFSMLKTAQHAILEENIIGGLILGTDDLNGNYKLKWDQECEKNVTTNSAGEYMSLMTLRPFLRYSDDFPIEKRKDGILCQLNGDMKTADFLNPLIILTTENNFGVVSGISGIAEWFTDKDIYNEVFQVHYSYILSVIAGIAVLLILLSFAFDIAVRAIKLSFLEIIAPIPIISFIEPEKSKQSMFKNWLTEVGKTWASLFVRLAALYFAFYFIQIVSNSASSTLSGNGFFTRIILEFFLMIGALIFAKKLPSMLETLIPGLKLDGAFQLNPFKKIKNEALGGTAVANAAMGAVGAGIGLAGSAAAHGLALYANDKKRVAEQGKLNDVIGNSMPTRNAAVGRYKQAMQNRNLQRTKLDNSRSLLQQNQHNQMMAARNGDIGLLQSLKNEEAQLIGNVTAQEGILNSANANLKNVRAEANAEIRAEKTKIAEQKAKVDELKNKKINKAGSWVTEMARGAAYGAQQGYKANTTNMVDAVKAGLKGTDQSALKRNYREDFSLNDEYYDRMTSFARIKNESGTSSEIAKQIKNVNNSLTRNQNDMNSINNLLANIVNGLPKAVKNEGINIVYNTEKEKFINEYHSYTEYINKNPGSKMGKEDFDNIYSAISAAVNGQKTIDELTKKRDDLSKTKESQSKHGLSE